MCKVFICLFLFILGCDVIRPITRIEYNGNVFYPNNGKAIDTHKEFVVVGPEAKIGKASIAILSGPELYENDNGQYSGFQINPRAFYFFDSGTFFHLEVDHSFTFDKSGQGTFILAAFEKRW